MTIDVWSPAQKALTNQSETVSEGVDSDLSDLARFVRGAQAVVQAVRSKIGAGSGKKALVVWRQDPDRALPMPTDEVARLYDGTTDLGGKLWLAGAMVKKADSIDLPSDDTNEVIQFVRDQIGIGDWSAIYYDPSTVPATLSWYPDGLGNLDYVEEIPADGHTTVELDVMLRVVRNVHQNKLRTPHNQDSDSSLWEDGQRHWAHRRAEARSQNSLLDGLSGVFGRPFIVDQEVSGHRGRYDLGLKHQSADGSVKVLAVLELKIARSHGSNGGHYSAAHVGEVVRLGVRQAAAYTIDHPEAEKVCVVFDLRKNDDCVHLLEAIEESVKLETTLEVLRCFPTSELVRDEDLATSN